MTIKFDPLNIVNEYFNKMKDKKGQKQCKSKVMVKEKNDAN